MFGLGAKKAFISYRNTIDANGNYDNFKLVVELDKWLVDKGFCKKCITISPEAIPPGTLYRPYDIAKFLSTTFNLLDDRDYFVILNKHYYTNNECSNLGNNYTSIWTEAENNMWKYYDRKEKFIYIANIKKNDFELIKHPITSLSRQSSNLLKTASMDFQRGHHGGDVKMFWYKSAYRYILECYNCGSSCLVSSNVLNERTNNNKPFVCKCGNKIRTQFVGKYIVQEQDYKRNTPALPMDTILRLIYLKDADIPYQIME